MTAEDATTRLREALADVLYADTWSEPKPEWGEDWHRRFPRWQADLAARLILASLVEHRDDVLDVLGMRPWGHWYEDDTPGRECNHGDRDGCSRSDHARTFPLYLARPKEQP